jgi:hypothetical protein
MASLDQGEQQAPSAVQQHWQMLAKAFKVFSIRIATSLMETVLREEALPEETGGL